jgi:hypothetical protein
LEELFKTDEVSVLMAKFIVPWNFVLLQDCCFWNFKNYVCFQLSLLCKNLLKSWVIPSYVLQLKTYGYKNYSVFTFANLEFSAD